MSNETLGHLALVGSLMLAAGLAAVGPLAGQERHVLPGDRVAVYNLAGEIEVVPGNGPDVVVEVMRGGDDQDRLQIEVGEVRGREALRVLYPGDRIIYSEMGRGSNTSLRVRDDGTFWSGSRGGDRVRISGRGSGLEAHADLRISVPAGVDLAVYLAAGEGQANNLEADLHFETGSGSVGVTQIVGNLSVDTGSGSIEIVGVQGDVTADTGSGTIEVADIVGDRFVADTGSGRVEGSNVTVDEVSVDTGSGRINLEGLSASEILCDTGSGSVTLELLTDAQNIDVDTGSGGVTLVIPDDFGAEVELDSGSGGVDVDVPTTITQAKRDYFRGTIGDGVGRVIVDTGSGGIDIRRR